MASGSDQPRLSTNLQSGRIVTEAWEMYRQKCIHQEAGPTQVAECKKVFYAGCLTILSAMSAIGAQELSDEDGAKVLESMWEEAMSFALGLPDNGAGGLTNEELRVKPH